MTAQPRGPGIQQSQPQLIPNAPKFSNYSTNQHQFSPRHYSSSPSVPVYFSQQNIPTSSHDMSKNQGVSGTPPTMMQQPPFFRSNGHRQRGTMHPPNPSGGFYQQYSPSIPMPPARYANTNVPPPTSPSYYPSHPQPYPSSYMASQSMQQQQATPMFNTMQQAQFQQSQTAQTHMSQQMPPQPVQQQSSEKRRKKIITIRDPNTNEDKTQDILKDAANKARQESLSTPPSGRSSATPPNTDIPAQFAAQVAAAANPNKQGVSVGKPLDPVMLSQTQPVMQQMQAEPHRVASPMLPPANQLNYSAQQQQPAMSSSPRHMVHSMTVPTSQMYNLQQQQPNQYPQQMLSSSPAQNMSILQPSQLGSQQFHMPLTEHHTQTATGYQLAPVSSAPHNIAQYGTSQISGNSPQQLIRPNSGSLQDPQSFITNSLPPAVHTYPIRDASHASAPVPEINQTNQNRSMTPQQNELQKIPPVAQNELTEVHTSATAASPELKEPSKVVMYAPAPPESEPAACEKNVQTATSSTLPLTEMHFMSGGVDIGKSKAEAIEEDGKLTSAVLANEKKTIIDQSPTQKIIPALASEPVVQGSGPIETKDPFETKAFIVTDPVRQRQDPVKEDTAVRLTESSGLEQKNIDIKEIQDKHPLKKLPEELPANEKKQSTETELKLLKNSAMDVTTRSSRGKTGIKEEVETVPSTKIHSPEINVVPATPTTPTQHSTVKVPTPSAKSVENSDMKVESTISHTAKMPKSVEKQSKPISVPSSEPVDRSDSRDTKKEMKEGRQQNKLEVASLVSQQKSDEMTGDNVIVNGNSSGESQESEVGQSKEKRGRIGDPVKSPSSVKYSKKTAIKTTIDTQESLEKESAFTKLSNPSEKSESSKTSSQSDKNNGVTEKDKAKSSATDLKYSNDQWSPANPKGKKQYNSEFLLQFQYKPSSMEKPKDLPNIDIVLDEPHKQIATIMQPMDFRTGGSDFTPNFIQRGPGRQTSRGDRRVGGSRTSMSGPKKVVSIERPEVELKRTANAWKPLKLDAKTAKMSEKDKETTEVLREVRAILNKLTPSKFADLMKKVLNLKIDTEEKLRGTIDLIFEKAIDEPNFSEAYANMCRSMINLRVTADDVDPQQQAKLVEFRKLLLTKCQREFEKNKSDQEHLLEMKTKMETNSDESIAAQLKEEYELAEKNERRRTLGNIRFIGELFKLRMLTESIMHNCIMSLFKARDDDHLESLCRLLTTIGKDLDHPKGKQRMDQYFVQISKIVREKKTSSRVRFFLQDVEDLRTNNWVPRAISVQGPKTIDQIHQDAKEEQEQLQLKMATAPPVQLPKQQGNRPGGRTGSRGHGGEDGWTKVPTVQRSARYDPSRMKLKSNQIDESNLTLGPSQAFKGWKSGSGSSSMSKTGSGSYSPSASMDRSQDTGRSNTPTSMKNRFSALSGQAQAQTQDHEYQRRHGGRQSSREGTRSGSRGSMGPPQSGRGTPRKENERVSLLETTRKMTSDRGGYDARQRSRESSPSLRPRPIASQQVPHKYNTSLDEEKMKTKSTNIILEFLSIVDYKEATECLEELNAPPDLLHHFIVVAHEITFEKTASARTNIGKLSAHLLKLGKISVNHYLDGMIEILKCAPDYEIDFPRVWEYLADQMTPIFTEIGTEISFECMIPFTAVLHEAGKAGVFISELLKSLSRNMPMQELCSRWQSANIHWSRLLQTDDEKSILNFVSQHQLEDFSANVPETTRMSQELIPLQSYKSSKEEDQLRVKNKLTDLLKSNSSNERIFDWVDANIPDRTKPSFLRPLTTSVCKNALKENEGVLVVSKDIFKTRALLLQKYLENDPNRELQALYALQSLMVFLEQPPNILRTFCEVLYDEDIISENSFYNWEKSTDPNEQEGRGVTMAAANPFFTWLREADPESD